MSNSDIQELYEKIERLRERNGDLAERVEDLEGSNSRLRLTRRRLLGKIDRLEGEIEDRPYPPRADLIHRAEKAEKERDQARRHEGVAAEQATEQARLAQEALRERDEALRTLKEVLDSHDETLRDIAEGKYAAENRPLTPDDITDGMVERGAERLREVIDSGFSPRASWAVRRALTAALAEPLARPEGAEEIERLIETSPWHLAGSCSAEADWMAERGVRLRTTQPLHRDRSQR